MIVRVAATLLMLEWGLRLLLCPATAQAGEAPGDPAPVRDPDVMYVPTPDDVVEKMLEFAELEKDDVVYDLGCGDGRIVIAAAKQAGCRAVGFDIDPRRVEQSRKNVKKHGVEHLVKIEQRDIFTLDLREATVVTLYLLPDLNVRLLPQLKQLKTGARIISHNFPIRGYRPDRTVELRSDDRHLHQVHLWQAPLTKSE